ncbi:MAG: TatD family hydrolase, partial [Elusimicrobia bacterium]|nr:TatD family hydrolase [Elusimicrobiota bacterium]
AHLSDSKFDADREEIIRRAFDAGIDAIVEIADGPLEWPKARALAAAHPGKIWWAGGLHPYHADEASDAVWKRLADIATDERFVAVGEIGLDYAKCPVPRERQIEAFEQALDLAASLKKPLVIHCRDAYEDLMPVLRRRAGRLGKIPGVVHCFSGNAHNAAELVEMGFVLGVDGPVTYPNAHALRASLEKIPAEAMVLETDSPYLPPQSRRGQRNEPACLPEIGKCLSAVLRRPPAETMPIWRSNSIRVFGLNPR